MLFLSFGRRFMWELDERLGSFSEGSSSIIKVGDDESGPLSFSIMSNKDWTDESVLILARASIVSTDEALSLRRLHGTAYSFIATSPPFTNALPTSILLKRRRIEVHWTVLMCKYHSTPN